MLLRFVPGESWLAAIAAAYKQPLHAIYYAITVRSLVNFYNRRIDATGVHAFACVIIRGAE